GNFYATLVATNPYGCSDTIIDTLTVHPLPIADFQYSNSCAGDTTHFWDVSDTVNAPLTNWKWDFMDATMLIGHDTLQNPDYLFATAGNSKTRLIITDNNGCQDDTLKTVVTHPAAPVSAFKIEENYDNVQGRIHLINETLNATGYEWDFDNGFTSTAKDPTITYDDEGTYNIKLISYNDNCFNTLTRPYTLLFKGLYVPHAFSPTNPMNGVRLFKPVGMNIKTYLVEVYDSWGKLLWSSTKLINGSPEEGWDGTYNGNLLPQDVYVWRIEAVFRDGSVWNSNNAGDHTNIPEKTYGTVTLLR
ncbi:MAG: PKD domain-containing protein, partial [Bacteroidales bacterium]|nr:PKD domain-containing protein [Bacteroidales bacterium]